MYVTRAARSIAAIRVPNIDWRENFDGGCEVAVASARASCFSSKRRCPVDRVPFRSLPRRDSGSFHRPSWHLSSLLTERVDGGLRAGFILEGTFASETKSKQAPRISRLGLSEADRSGSNISLFSPLYCNAPGRRRRIGFPGRADPNVSALFPLVLRHVSARTHDSRRAMAKDLDTLISLGIPRARAAFALKEHGGDAEAAADWCFSVRHAPRVHRRRLEERLFPALMVVLSRWLLGGDLDHSLQEEGADWTPQSLLNTTPIPAPSARRSPSPPSSWSRIRGSGGGESERAGGGLGSSQRPVPHRLLLPGTRVAITLKQDQGTGRTGRWARNVRTLLAKRSRADSLMRVQSKGS